MTISRRPLRLTLAALVSLTLSIAPTRAADLYWDADLTAAGNDTFGSGLGGAGTWDTSSTAFWNPSSPGSNVAWTNGNQALFAGTPGEVLIPSVATGQTRIERTVSGLTFNADGFVVTGGTTGVIGGINLGASAGNLVSTSGTGTIAARLAGTGGFNVSGGGVIRLAPATNVNITSGPVSITGGSTLDLSRSGDIGSTGVGSGAITLDNGTLKNSSAGTTDTTFVSGNRGLVLGAGGARLDPQQVGLYSGIVSGNVLTKIGAGELRFSGGANQVSTYTQTVIEGGMISIGQATTLGNDRNLGAVPASFMQDNIVMNSGTILRFLGSDGLNNTTVNLHQNRGITLNADATFNADTANGVIAGKITGAGPITKLGGSILNLAAANDYVGGTIIGGGTLRATNTTGSATGDNLVLLNSGSIDGTGFITGLIEAAGGTRIAAGIGNANSTLTLSTVTTLASNSIIDALVGENGNDVLNIATPGGLNVSSGVILNLSGSNTTVAPAGKTYTLIDYNSSYVGDFSSFNINNATGYDVVVTDDVANSRIVATFGSTIRDKQWVTNGDGNWSNVAADDVNWTDGASPATNPGAPNGIGTTARFLGAITAPVTVTISDVSKGVGHLIFDNANKYTIAGATTAQRLAFNTYEGNASIDVLQGSHDITARVTFTQETDLNIAAGSSLLLAGAGSSTGVLNNGGVNILGGGTLLIRQDWGGFGDTNIVNGTLKFDISAAGLATNTNVNIGANGVFDMNLINDTFGYLNGSGPIINGGNVTLNGNNTTPAVWNGNYSGTNASRTLTKNGAGVQVLGGNNDFITSTVSAGTLLANNDTGFALGTTGVTTVASGATLGGDGTLGNRVSVSAGGIMSPGAAGVNSVGTLTLDSAVPTAAALTLATSTSRLNFDLGAGLTSDTIALVNGAAGDIVFATGNNTINFTDTTSGSLTSGNYTLFSSDVASAYAGSFAVDGSNNITGGLVVGTGLTAYESAVLKLVGNDIVLSLTAASSALLGDFNGDGFVNLADYTVWRDNLGATEGTLLSGNGTGGVIDADDYNAWKTNFGASSPGSLIAGTASVPEPSTVITLLAGLAATALCVRKQRSTC
ncbi:beta strand repeat-containing protein [Aeoliella sp. SH292]|uniref:beta strand repeat-containing protein n=1 Tax=Aeoliella sp. SH292 TaxID=3454464 RepID=UPI003F9523F1